MDLVRDVLDKLLIDRNHHPIGRVDGIVLLLEEGKPPRVTCIESGARTWSSRLHPRIGRLVRWMARRWGLKRGKPTRIGWDKVTDVGIEVKVDANADEMPTLAWEHWLRDHVVARLPGGK